MYFDQLAVPLPPPPPHRKKERNNMTLINIYNTVEQLPPDALFGIKQRFSLDQRPQKVDLGIGAYRDNSGRPWVLPAVRAAEAKIHADPNYNHEYLGITGLPALTEGASKVIFGESLAVENSDRIVSVQSLSGTGALHLAAKFIHKYLPSTTVYLSDPTWANHKAIFEAAGFQTAVYSYWDQETKSLDIKGFIKAIESAPQGSLFVLHACAHNPTGLDPTKEQWTQILDSLVQHNHIVLFDSAYQGFASGDLTRDAFAIRLGMQKLAKHPTSAMYVCQSFAKNVGMYGERVGCFHLVLPNQGHETNLRVQSAVRSQIAKIQRTEVSNPPSYGAKIVSTIFSDAALTEQWHRDMVTMSTRIASMRRALTAQLKTLQTPGTWDHIVQQCGMFSYTGLSKDMVRRLEEKHAVYMVPNGRASIAGLNEGNVEYVAKAIDEVVRFFLKKPRL